MLDAVKKNKLKGGVCSESSKTKLIHPELLMWESYIVQDHTHLSGASSCVPDRRSQGSAWSGKSQEQTALEEKVAQFPTTAQEHNWHCIFQNFLQQILPVFGFHIRATSWG